jgi:hypothetical protein
LREINLLRMYPKTNSKRRQLSIDRGVSEKVVASYRDERYFDGERKYGYGGLKQDFRWEPVALDILKEYGLSDKASILQVNSEKGFLLDAFFKQNKSLDLIGTESSNYAISNSYNSKNYTIIKNELPNLPFCNCSLDLVISLGNTYTLTLGDAYRHLLEIERVKKKFSFITLATYDDPDEYWLFKEWSLLGNLLLKKDEWIELLKLASYTGDYYFIDAKYLGLKND